MFYFHHKTNNVSCFRKRVFEHLKLCGCELRNGTEELDQAVQFLHDYGMLPIHTNLSRLFLSSSLLINNSVFYSILP